MNKPQPEEEDEAARCRHVRDELDRQLGTLAAAFVRLERLAKLRKRRGVRTALARPHGKDRSAARQSKPVSGKVVHQA